MDRAIFDVPHPRLILVLNQSKRIRYDRKNAVSPLALAPEIAPLLWPLIYLFLPALEVLVNTIQNQRR